MEGTPFWMLSVTAAPTPPLCPRPWRLWLRAGPGSSSGKLGDYHVGASDTLRSPPAPTLTHCPGEHVESVGDQYLGGVEHQPRGGPCTCPPPQCEHMCWRPGSAQCRGSGSTSVPTTLWEVEARPAYMARRCPESHRLHGAGGHTAVPATLCSVTLWPVLCKSHFCPPRWGPGWAPRGETPEGGN